MADLYGRIASMSLGKESTANTAVIPSTYILFDEEAISTLYEIEPTLPVSADRSKLLRNVQKAIPAIAGDIKISIEPRQYGNFLAGVYGGITTGNYLPFTGGAGTFTVGETVTGGTSLKTATVAFVSGESDYLLVTSPSGNFTAAETITGGSSGATGTVTAFDTTVYGHVGTLPANSMNSYSLQVNYQNAAIRYCGLRFHALDPINQANNVMSATVKVMGQSQFRHAYVTAITSSGAGSKVISVDQTQGLVVGDVIKIYRPSTSSFIDLNGSGVKTNTITAISAGVSITISTLTTSTAVGDLLVISPQTPAYTTGNELGWIGQSLGQIGNVVGSLATSVMEDFTMNVVNDFEARWQAAGTNISNRFAAALIQKGVSAKGSFKAYYQDETFYSLLRKNTAQAFRIKTIGPAIGSTALNFEIRWTFPQVQFLPYQTPIAKDKVVEQTIPFDVYKDATTGYYARCLLVTNISSF